ncbi:MAG: type II toxin-antitoxin system VapC family toxin [Roseiarcus sp.]|jgi:tRNA(fMet)-specific endonuclease VapC
MKRLMLDTNSVSHLLNRQPNLVKRVVGAPMAALCVSAVTEGEMRFGLARRPEAKTLHAAVVELLRRLDVLPWTSATAQRYGVVRAELERRGRPLAPLDLMIAAHALEAGAVLITSDRAFRFVVGLKVEDWTLA